MGIPCHRRINILKVQAIYHKNVLRPFLLTQGIDLSFFMVGTDSLEGAVFSSDDPAFVYESQPQNILSLKFNRLIDFAKERDCDALMTMGSDDLIPPKLFLDMIEIAIDNEFVSAPSQMIMYDIKSKNAYIWKGYHPPRILGLGAGRVYTKKLLTKLPPNPFGEGLKMNQEEATVDPKIKKVILDQGKNLSNMMTSKFHSHDCQLLSLKASTALNTIQIFLDRELVEHDVLSIHDKTKFFWLTDDVLNRIVELE